MSLAKAEDGDKLHDNKEPVQDNTGSVAQVQAICKEVHIDLPIVLKASSETSNLSQERCINVSLPLTTCMQDLVNERMILDDKENLLESFQNGSSLAGSSCDLPPHVLHGDSLTSPINTGTFSFDNAVCDIETHSECIWHNPCDADGIFDIETVELLEQSLAHGSDGTPLCQNAMNMTGSFEGTQGALKNGNRKHLVPLEKVKNAAQVTASLTENTGKKRGRKKIYDSGSCLEEEISLKRARNNEACGKYRTMKKKKLEQLFEEERVLNEDNNRLTEMCKQMEAEKKLLTSLLLSILK